MLQEHFFDTGKVSINYAQGPPSGSPLVLLHGVPGRWQEFLPLIPALATRWSLYALDFRGHGRSGRVPGGYRPEHYTADVKAFLQGLLTESAILFGLSAGGLVALDVAAQLPEKARALVVGDSPVDMEALAAWMSTAEFASHFAALRELAGSGHSVATLAHALGDLEVHGAGEGSPRTHKELPGMDAAHLYAWAKTISQLDPGVLAYHAEGRGREFLEGLDMEGILRKVACPVLLVRGNPEYGALMSDRAAEHAVSVLPDAIQVQIEREGHDLGLDTWEEGLLLRAVTDFLESL
jgi:pimeloyl-ACP methyl ester carboxylesterase